ncbi:MAG: trigger factor [Clostridia bacterium]|nr:trigger factor [Clostridia bacterium]
MQVKTNEIKTNLIGMEIESTPEVIEEGIERAYRARKNEFRIKGFRPGKASRHIVEQVYGKEIFYNDAADYVLNKEYEAALEETGLDVVSYPQNVKLVEFSAEKAVFTLEVYVRPEVKLGQYKGIEVTKADTEVTDEDVEEELKKEAEKNSRMISVDDRAAQLGDTVSLDFEGFVDGEAFEGGKGENYSLKLGSGQFIPGFEDQLVGAQIGQDVEVNVTFPEEYQEKTLAGKPAVFKCKVNEIKVQELPVIDDDFASDVSEFETLDEYKADLRKKIGERKEKQAKNQIREEAMKKALDNAEIEIPEPMIASEQDAEVKRMEEQLRSYGMKLDQYLQYMGVDEAGYRERIRPQAEINVRRDLVMDAIAKAEELTVTEEEVDKEYAAAAEYMKMPLEQVKTVYAGSREGIERDIKRRKAADMIADSAVQVEKAAEAE